MLQKPETCSSCPLYTTGKGFVPDNIAPGTEYVMHGEAPGSTEIEVGKPFQGKAGFVLDNWLLRAVPTLQLAKEKGKISYMNVLRCLPPEKAGRPYPSGEEREQAEACCSQYTDLGSAHTVILLGEMAQRRYFKAELEAEDATDRQLQHDLKGVSGRMGRVYERDGKRWVFAPHPAYILRQPALVEAGQQCLRIAAGVDKVAEVNYMRWEDAIGEIGR